MSKSQSSAQDQDLTAKDSDDRLYFSNAINVVAFLAVLCNYFVNIRFAESRAMFAARSVSGLLPFDKTWSIVEKDKIRGRVTECISQFTKMPRVIRKAL